MLSLILSVETPQLDTHPVVRIASNFVGATTHQPLHGEQGYLGTLLAKEEASYVETIQPGDLPDGREPLSIASADGVTSEWTLFDHFLEKGVIRRARLSLAVFDRKITPEEAAAWCVAAQHRPAPLTA